MKMKKRMLVLLCAMIFAVSCKSAESATEEIVETVPIVSEPIVEKTIEADPEPALDTPSTKPSATDPCETICLRSTELKCKKTGDICTAACKETQEVPICAEEMANVMRCVIKEPAQHWECSEEDIAAVKDGYCQTEQERFIRCLAAIMK